MRVSGIMSYSLNSLCPLITPIVVPYIIPYITPFKEFRLLYNGLGMTASGCRDEG